MQLDWPTAAVILGAMAAIFPLLYRIIPHKRQQGKPTIEEVELLTTLGSGVKTKISLLEADHKNFLIQQAEIKQELKDLNAKVEKKFDDLNVVIREFLQHGYKS